MEERKKYEYEPGVITLSINGREIKAEELKSNIKLDLPTRPCYCICFSNKKDAPEMYDKFSADICLEFNMDSLTKFIELIFSKNAGCEVECRPITYYDINPPLNMTNPHNSTFMKKSIFEDEDEYRLAVFLPYDENTVFDNDEIKVEILKKCSCKPENIDSCTCYFIYLNNGLSDKFSSCISNVYTKS